MNLYKELENNNVILNGHFNLRSGTHSDKYINKDAIYCNHKMFKKVILELGKLINEKFFLYEYEVITGPAIAGAILAAPLSLQLKKSFVYPEKDSEGNMKFNRGYDKIIKNKKILIVEDIITTGLSVSRTYNAIKDYGGINIGIVSIWNRTGINDSFIVPSFSLINEFVCSWWPENCQLCKDGVKLINPKTGETHINGN